MENRDHRFSILAPRSSILDRKLRSPLHIFETQLSLARLAMMDQHRAHGVAVVPGVVYLEMILGAAAEVLNAKRCVVDDVVLHEALTLPDDQNRTIQLILRPEADHFVFQLYSQAAEQSDMWRLHASGKALRAKGMGQGTEVTNTGVLDLDQVKARCQESSVATLVAKVRERGIHVTEQSQSIAQLWCGESEALGLIEMSEAVRAHANEYQIHPALFDAALQVLEAALPDGRTSTSATYMLMGMERLEFFARPTERMWVHGVLRGDAQNGDEVLCGEALLLNENGEPLAKLLGLQFKRVAAEAILRAQYSPLNEWLYEVQWQEQARAREELTAAQAFPKLAAIAEAVQPKIAALYEANALRLYDDLLPRLDALCGAYVAQALRQLGFEFEIGTRFDLDKLMARLNVQTRHRRLFERMLLMLAQDGVLTQREREWEVVHAPIAQDAAHAMNELLAQYPACSAELTLTKRCGEGMAAALRGDIDPLHLLFPEGSLADTEQLYQEAPMSKAFNLILRDAIASTLHSIPRERKLRVLEIGGGTGGTTTRVLPILPPERTEYVFTDIGQLFTTRAAKKFKDYSFVRYQTLDISAELAPQGFALHEFDLIIAANVLHATSDLRRTLANVQALLASQGLLVLLEGSVPQRFGDLTVGLTEGWWSYADRDLRPDYALLNEDKWLDLLTSMNFTEAMALPQGEERKGVLQTQAVILARGPVVSPPLTGDSGVLTTSSNEQNNWLIFADESGVAHKLAQLFEASNQSCTLVHANEAHGLAINPTVPEDCKRALAEIATAPYRGVIDLRPLDTPLLHEHSSATLREAQHKVIGGALHLVQALATNENLKSTRLWLVTRNAQQVIPPLMGVSLASSNIQEHTPLKGGISLAQSPLWGLGKVIAMEHPELQCTRIDLDAENAEEAAHLLYDEIQNAESEDQIALRNGARYVPRLARSGVRIEDSGLKIENGESRIEPRDHQSSILAPQSSILITGGLAGLGLLVAKWMVEHGARHLVLMGRSAPNEEAKASLLEMEKLGAQIIVAQADVADEQRMSEVFAQIDAAMPPLRGVIHSAGAIDDGVLLQQDWSRFEKVMRAKVFGAWNLHTLTHSRALDFFVMFSTGASLIGSAGQGNHAAANMFMDMLAHHRRAQGLPALSINWGAWSEIGTVIRHQQSERFTIGGKSVITPQQGLKIFARLLRDTPPQIGVLPVNWSEAFEQMGERKSSPFFSELLREVKPQRGLKIDDRGSKLADRESSGKPQASFLSQLNAAPKSQRWSLLQAFVREQSLKVLGLDLSRAISLQRPLTELGLDSLMAVELRNALGKGVEQTLPATLLFDHPTIEALVNHLGKNVLALESAVLENEAHVANGKASLVEKETALDELSEEEMAALLEERLG